MGIGMHRTQILLEEQQYRFLQAVAKRSGKSMSAILRDVVNMHMREQPHADDSLWDIVGMADGDEGTTARDHDKYLYRGKR